MALAPESADMVDFETARAQMVRRQIAGRGITDSRVLDAMRTVPREAFVTESLAEFAYDDSPLPIEEGQTISQPLVVAEMIAAAAVGPADRVLDVGTGSGYSAAVLSRIAAEVYTIERHEGLSESARRRFEWLGYDNIRSRIGDGSLGWPEEAPFDAILVAASGRDVPKALREQLRIGGRLIIPVGGRLGRQALLRVRRTGEDDYRSEDLGSVAFVPLIGEQGWAKDDPNDDPPQSTARAETTTRQTLDPVALIRDAAEPFAEIDSAEIDRFADRLRDARVVLIGEATHGTSEFYRTRARITRRLIQEHGFTTVAVEADWPDAARIDQYVRRRAPSPAEEPAFSRFPTWMWRNTDVQDFVHWLHRYNQDVNDPARQAGFYGLDLYSLAASIEAVLDYLDKVDPETARVARERYGCLTPWQRDPATYGRAALTRGFETCEAAVTSMLQDLLGKRLDYLHRDSESFLDAEQNARLVASAEQYYRVMYRGSAESWNLRDRHMFDTLEAVLAARGHNTTAKAVVWAHNSHIGNAAATEMGIARGELNIGQLCRERFGDAALLVGFGTDHGTVAAATDWDGPMEVKRVRPSHEDSYERLCHEAGPGRFLLDFRAEGREELQYALLQSRLERAIGVIYRPETELWSHYFEASLPRQFDAYIWFDETRAVEPLSATRVEGMPETYPFGL